LLPWTKREGVLLLLAIGLALALELALALWRRQPQRYKRAAWAMVAMAAAAIVLAGPWWYFAERAAISSPGFQPVSLELLWANRDRLPVILGLLGQTLLGGRFNLAWPLAAFMALSLLLARRPLPAPAIRAWMPPLVAFGYLALAALVYVFSDYVPLQQHVLSSAYRLAGQATPILFVWLGWLATDRPSLLPAPSGEMKEPSLLS
jgi:hypothetical protein